MDNLDPISLLLILFGIAILFATVFTLMWYTKVWPVALIYLTIKYVGNLFSWLFK
jgi:hypothetical protein